MFAATSSSVKFAAAEDAAVVCRFWPNPPSDVMARALNNNGIEVPILQSQIDALPDEQRARECGAIRQTTVDGMYWIMYDNTNNGAGGGDPRTLSADDRSWTRGTDFDNCGDNPPPPAPISPPSPTPPPMAPAMCSALAPWWTYRSHIEDEPKAARTQCIGIIEWFCRRTQGGGINGNGNHGLSNKKVNNVYCKNAVGDIVYCEARYGSPTCEGEATCAGFRPTCDTSRRSLDCANEDNANRGISSFNGTWTDSNGRGNCRTRSHSNPSTNPNTHTTRCKNSHTQFTSMACCTRTL